MYTVCDMYFLFAHIHYIQNVYTRMHACTHTHAHTHMHARTHAHTHTHTHTHTHMHTHARARTYASKQAHTFTLGTQKFIHSVLHRLIVQFVADHWLAYKSYQTQQLGLQMNQFPQSVLANEPRYTLNRLQLEVDYFILRATRWIMMGHKLVLLQCTCMYCCGV